jgi:putative transposase
MSSYKVPDGKIVKGWSVRLDPTPEQATRFARDCGARRFAYNWAVGEIKFAFEHGSVTGEYDPRVWSAYALRKRWNKVKDHATRVIDAETGQVTGSWWAQCSKEAYANGIADATLALRNWHESKAGRRSGPRMRFPRFKKRSKDRPRCTYTTGALRVESSRTVVLPGVGRVRTQENIRNIWRHLRRGSGRVLSATIWEKAGNWQVSLRLEISKPWQPPERLTVAGVDVGIGGHLLTVMAPDGSVIEKVPNPRALRSALVELRKANRSLSRKVEGSSRWRKARRRVAQRHARAASIRSDTLHKATTHLAKTHGAVVIEDLAVAQLGRGIRSHRKAWTDAAAGEFRRQMTYKAGWFGCELWVADRWFPSSKICSCCSLVNAELKMLDRTWTCGGCGTIHDRDENAGANLACLPASWAEALSDGKTAPVRRVTMKRVNHPGRVAA